MTRTLPAFALILALTACGSSGPDGLTPKTTPANASVSPISKADLHKVVQVICLEPTSGIETIIAGIQAQSPARMRRVFEDMATTCPDRLQDLHDYLGG